MNKADQQKQDEMDDVKTAIEMLETVRDLLEPVGQRDEYFRRTVIAELEGKDSGSGWLGNDFLIDRVKAIVDVPVCAVCGYRVYHDDESSAHEDGIAHLDCIAQEIKFVARISA